MVSIKEGKITITMPGTFQSLQNIRETLTGLIEDLSLPENSNPDEYAIYNLNTLLKATEFNNYQWLAIENIAFNVEQGDAQKGAVELHKALCMSDISE